MSQGCYLCHALTRCCRWRYCEEHGRAIGQSAHPDRTFGQPNAPWPNRVFHRMRRWDQGPYPARRAAATICSAMSPTGAGGGSQTGCVWVADHAAICWDLPSIGA